VPSVGEVILQETVSFTQLLKTNREMRDKNKMRIFIIILYQSEIFFILIAFMSFFFIFLA
jgi:hypothetical protein